MQKQAVLSRRNKAEAPKEEQGGAYGDEARGPHPGADHSGLGEPEPPQAAAAAPVPGGHFGDGASEAAIAAAWHERRELRCGGGGDGWEVDASLAVARSGASGGGARWRRAWGRPRRRRRVFLLALGRRHRGARGVEGAGLARVDGVRSCWPEDHEVEGARARAGAGRWSAQLRWWSWGCGPLIVVERTREEGPGVVGPCMPRAMAGQKAEASRKEGRKGEVFQI